MAKYGIKITYSNGDEEDGLYGNFASKERKRSKKFAFLQQKKRMFRMKISMS